MSLVFPKVFELLWYSSLPCSKVLIKYHFMKHFSDIWKYIKIYPCRRSPWSSLVNMPGRPWTAPHFSPRSPPTSVSAAPSTPRTCSSSRNTRNQSHGCRTWKHRKRFTILISWIDRINTPGQAAYHSWPGEWAESRAGSSLQPGDCRKSAEGFPGYAVIR